MKKKLHVTEVHGREKGPELEELLLTRLRMEMEQKGICRE